MGTGGQEGEVQLWAHWTSLCIEGVTRNHGAGLISPSVFFFLDKSSAAVAECAPSLCFPKTFCFTFLVFVFEESCSPACTPVSF